jgi:hypothetical protein
MLTKSLEVNEYLHKDILTLTETAESYVGNDYKTYEDAIREINDKYVGTASWGVLTTRTIVNLRAAFILGEGIKVKHTTSTRAEAERELSFIEAFRKYNDLDGEMDQEITKEAELEGKVALKIMPDKEPFQEWPGMITARFISWYSRKYTVTADPNDYLWYQKLSWNAGSSGSGTGQLSSWGPGELKENEFIYAKFGGRLNSPNEARPAIAECLTMIDRLDKALRDLREIDHLFASPTPLFECADKNMVDDVTEYVEKTNWVIGKSIATMAKFSLVAAPVAGVDTLIKEIELTVKMISGATGIPIHYLGLLDLLKNRATGENTRELIMAATSRERQTWIAVYEELFTKAMLMWNAAFAAQYSKEKQLDPTKVKVDIPQITQEHWDRIQNVLIPAALGNIISREHVASQIPGIDIEKETELREKREADESAKAKEEAALIADRMDANEDSAKGKQKVGEPK